MVIKKCKECKEEKQHYAKGLCDKCYHKKLKKTYRKEYNERQKEINKRWRQKHKDYWDIKGYRQKIKELEAELKKFKKSPYDKIREYKIVCSDYGQLGGYEKKYSLRCLLLLSAYIPLGEGYKGFLPYWFLFKEMDNVMQKEEGMYKEFFINIDDEKKTIWVSPKY